MATLSPDFPSVLTRPCLSIRIRVPLGTHKCHKGRDEREFRERFSLRFKSTSKKRKEEDKD